MTWVEPNVLEAAHGEDQSLEVTTISVEEGIDLCTGIIVIMSQLNEQLEEEARFIREGNLEAAGELQPEKSRLANQYIHNIGLAQSVASQLKEILPEEVERLRQAHEEFRSILKINLAALAAAQTVSREIVDHVAKSVGGRENPSVYQRDGAMTSQQQSGAQGLALSKRF